MEFINILTVFMLPMVDLLPEIHTTNINFIKFYPKIVNNRHFPYKYVITFFECYEIHQYFDSLFASND